MLSLLKFLISEEMSLAPSTILAYRNSLTLTLGIAFNIDYKDKAFSLLARAQFIKNPPSRNIGPQWSLDEAFSALTPRIPSLSKEEVFLATLFLVALGSGNRSSELAALDRNSVRFEKDSVILQSTPRFLFKNQS